MFVNGKMKCTKDLDGTEDHTETLEMWEECASKSMETETLTTDTSPGGTATMVSVKPGMSIKKETDTQLNQ